MEGGTAMKESVLLMENFDACSKDLHYSLLKAGCNCHALVINDDGFLPENVLSVYGWFLGKFEGKPRYFNQITVPDYWEISGSNSGGSVHDREHERGRIFYTEPLNKRLVKIVDWLDERGIVRASDHYNRFGALYARTIFNKKGLKVNRAYFNAKGEEIIVENFVTGDIILNSDRIHIFHTKTEFVCHFLKAAGLAGNRIFYNSLSTPFFVSQRLGGGKKEDVLFWQEGPRNDIPGNMKMILEGKSARTRAIMVQKKGACERLIELGANPDMLNTLGFCYPFERDNRRTKDILICTNSDRVAQIKKLVSVMPEFHFHIAAITEMSAKLLSVGNYENVTLYPGVKMPMLDELFDRCDIYLDINYESEIVNAINRAFLQNMLILAFRDTMHRPEFVPEIHRYEMSHVDKMAVDIRAITEDANKLSEHLKAQRRFAMAEDPQEYSDLLG
jgi:accessory Sec system glycosyltransferase GtfB